jgi:hypothetical protein
MTVAEQIADLERRLEASRGLAGYADRIKAIEARLAELRAQ